MHLDDATIGVLQTALHLHCGYCDCLSCHMSPVSSAAMWSTLLGGCWALCATLPRRSMPRKAGRQLPAPGWCVQAPVGGTVAAGCSGVPARTAGNGVQQRATTKICSKGCHVWPNLHASCDRQETPQIHLHNHVLLEVGHINPVAATKRRSHAHKQRRRPAVITSMAAHESTDEW